MLLGCDGFFQSPGTRAKIWNSDIFDLAESLPNYVNLGIGEPDFRTPSFIARAAKKAIDDGFSKYTVNRGLPELREEISKEVEKENGIKA